MGASDEHVSAKDCAALEEFVALCGNCRATRLIRRRTPLGTFSWHMLCTVWLLGMPRALWWS